MVLQHKYRSLKYLRNMVPQQSGDVESMSLAETQTERDSLLLLVMLHCLLEIASGSIMEWTFHMRGALLIMKFYSELRGPSRGVSAFSPQVLELVYGFFAEKDIFLATTAHESEEFTRLQWSTEVQSMFPFLGSLSMKIHPCMGLSPELLDIISSITSLARRQRNAEGSQGTRESFDILRQRLRRSKSLSERLQLTGLINLHSAAFEEAAWIYLHHAVHDQYRHDGDAIQEIHLPKLLDILQHIHAIQGELLGFIPYPMWALFIASCSVSSDEERLQILEWFTILKCNKPISNVPSTMAAVEAIWKRRDLESDGGYSRSLQYSLNWRAAISQLGWKMPLT
jgi:Fungal specific transcription factor domain